MASRTVEQPPAAVADIPSQPAQPAGTAAPVSADAACLRQTMTLIDSLAQDGFSEIAAVAKLALAALETPDGYRHPENIAWALSAIWAKAEQIEAFINNEAEKVGCNYVNDSQRRRWDARAAARGQSNSMRESGKPAICRNSGENASTPPAAGWEPQRVLLALQAAWELENIADIVIGMCPDLKPEQMAIRGLSIRAGNLSRVIMSALDDELDPVEGIRARFTGERRPAAGLGAN